ncbi:MAG TPA: hypothetical protein PLU30_16295 [Verrucomicrobiae bacterium]|nr:hypothetical protein [Verrucomicrobiae bacterium]
MSGRRVALATWLFLGPGCLIHAAPAAVPQPWQRPYGGADATGAVVLAYWGFEPGAEGADASGRGRALALRGSSRFTGGGVAGGGALECFGSGADRLVGCGAMAKRHPSLSPAGAFTIEMWIKPKPELADTKSVWLLDKKYLDYRKEGADGDRDYCLKLVAASGGRRRLVAQLGFGKDSADFGSGAFDLPSGEWAHVAFAYDGAGVGRFYVNGRDAGGSSHPGRGAVSPGQRDLVIGDRIGSNFSAFPGWIDGVRILGRAEVFRTGRLEIDRGSGRWVFRRMEQGASFGVRVCNQTGGALSDCIAVLGIESVGLRKEIRVGQMGLDEVRQIAVDVDTSLRPERYRGSVVVTGMAGETTHRAELPLELVIVPRPSPGRMPVVMWGTGDLPRIKEIGFTHQVMNLADFSAIWDADGPVESLSGDRLTEAGKTLDEHLAEGIGVVATLSPGHWLQDNAELGPKFGRVDRGGKIGEKPSLCASFSEVSAFARRVGESVARTFGGHPALEAALINTEVRDGTRLCFHPHDLEACRRATGRDVPDLVKDRGGVRYATLRGFPGDRAVADDDPILAYYRWFWREGDGWNRMHTMVHEGLKSTGRRDLWTFFDPAVRVPPAWGSGGGVDVISQWTYSYPDPIKMGQACDELFAMAKGRPGQRVMKMTQIIWYRTQTAPELPKDESKRVAWEREIPDARFITIAPDHLREAFWCKVARPVQGIMYHGWGSLVEAEHRGYRFTNPETAKVLAGLIRDVIGPLGPTLRDVPDRRADVGLLESFASNVFAGRGTFGWGHTWVADAHLVLQWAQLQPEILYEETIMRDGLSGFKVLMLPGCDVLPRSVVAQIAEFQRKGGIVVGDEFLCPAVCPDIVLPSLARTGAPDKDKAELQKRAAALRAELDPFYRRFAESDNPDVVIRCRRTDEADYVFAINDRRGFGDYVGQHGKVMERGLPSKARITVRRPGAVLYDLLAHRELEVKGGSEGVEFDAALGPGEGRTYLLVPRRIAGVAIDPVPESRRGGRAEIRVRVADQNNGCLAAVVPVKLEVRDPDGRSAEFSGYYGAANGEMRVGLDIAPNDAIGKWSVRATELASGRSTEAQFEVIP